MEGCLYKNNNNYYLITNIASYYILVLEFQTLKSYFISKDTFDNDYEIVDYNCDNIQIILNQDFKDNINYSNLKDFNQIIYNKRIYYIRSWFDVFEFASGNL